MINFEMPLAPESQILIMSTIRKISVNFLLLAIPEMSFLLVGGNQVFLKKYMYINIPRGH